MSFNTQSMGPQNPIPSAFLLAGSPAICSNCFASCLVVIPSLQVTVSTSAMKPPPANCPVASESQITTNPCQHATPQLEMGAL